MSTNHTDAKTRHTLRWTAALLAAAGLAAGCSSSNDASVTSTSAAADASSTTAKSTGTSAKTSGTTTKSDSSGGSQDDVDPWVRSAQDRRDDVGDEFTYDCPADGTEHTIWGTNTYTDDSSICTAAVHMGLITFDDGGEVTIVIEDGLDEYIGSESNDVTSNSYGSWGGSFSFPDADPLDVTATIDWARAATFYDGREGPITVTCEANGEPGNVWGTTTYTADSSICAAAVHAGVIQASAGGEVTFEIVTGLDAYEGTTANGITTLSYGPYGTAFIFAED